MPKQRKIVPIVEGEGDAAALPNLLTRILYETLGRYDLGMPGRGPKNAHGKNNLTRPGGVERFVQLALTEADCAGVLVLLDADDDCPVTLAQGLAERIRTMGVPCPVAVVVATVKFENWLVASLDTIVGQDLGDGQGLAAATSPPDDPEACNALRTLEEAMPAGRIYKKSTDQLAMARLLDTTTAAERSRSFRRLVDAIRELAETPEGRVTP